MPDQAGPDPVRLTALRREYASAGLAEQDLAATWHEQLAAWVADADAADLTEINAVVLATATPDGRPSARHVLLKGYDDRGLVVFTDYTSRKGREIAVNPRACIVVPWVPLERQVIVEGAVERVSREESQAYFRDRPRGAQLSAATSEQSKVVASRAVLEQAWSETEQRYADTDVPLPDSWGGYRLVPDVVEFWQGRRDRLHDRLRYSLVDGSWLVERLSP